VVAAYQSFAHASASTGASIVVTKPSGTVDGDLLIAVGRAGSGASVTAPAGWTTHASSLGTGSPLWTKIASGEGASYTFTQTALATSKVVIVRVNGQASSTPVDVAAGVSGTAALVIPTVTPTGANRLLLQIASHHGAGTWTPPGTATERFDALDAASFAAAGGDEIVGAGATGTRTWTPSVTGSTGVAYMLAIAPAPDANTGRAFLSLL
jgi:hypothetical protein